MWLTFVIQNWKSILGVALIAGAGLTGYIKGKAAVQSEWDVATALQIKAQLEKNQTDAAKLRKLEETKNENLDYVSNLYFDLGKSQRLRLPKTPCAGNQTSTDSPTSEGIIPAGISGSAEQAINDFDLTYRNAALRSDKIVEDCRVLNDFVRDFRSNP